MKKNIFKPFMLFQLMGKALKTKMNKNDELYPGRKFYKKKRIILPVSFIVFSMFTSNPEAENIISNNDVQNRIEQNESNSTNSVEENESLENKDSIDKSNDIELKGSKDSESEDIEKEQIAETIEQRTINNTTKESTEIQVHFIDVGQGDSIFIDAGDYDILIDGGDNKYGQTVVSYLNSLGTDDIELLISTHPHADHIGGLDTVLNHFKIEEIIWSGETSDTITFKDYWSAVISEGSHYKEDSKLTYNIFEGLDLKIIETGDRWSNTNDYSVVTLLDYNDVEILFTGDMEKDAELSSLNMFSDIDVLKVAHHGSHSSTSQQFMNVIKPEYAVISSGLNNKYGHPHNETLQTLNQYNVNVYRTDEKGNIILTTDGNNITFNTKPSVYVENIPSTTPSTSKPVTNPKEAEETSKKETSVATQVTPTTPPTTNSVIISKLDKKAEYVTITNNGSSSVNLMGWRILSVTGDQTFTFPDYVLNPGKSVKVGGFGASCDFTWEVGRGIWNNSKSDPAELYNSNGKLVYRFND